MRGFDRIDPAVFFKLKSTNNKPIVKSGANHTEYEWSMTGITSQQMW